MYIGQRQGVHSVEKASNNLLLWVTHFTNWKKTIKFIFTIIWSFFPLKNVADSFNSQSVSNGSFHFSYRQHHNLICKLIRGNQLEFSITHRISSGWSYHLDDLKSAYQVALLCLITLRRIPSKILYGSSNVMKNFHSPFSNKESPECLRVSKRENNLLSWRFHHQGYYFTEPHTTRLNKEHWEQILLK